ncbi:MAG: prephenate dehydrogenase [Chloroflexota bacterium]
MNLPAPFSLSNCRVLIVGLGLMGGSLALALRGKCQAVWGVDLHENTCLYAKQKGMVENAFADITQAPQPDLVILAIPVEHILTLLGQLGEVFHTQVIVMDIGSTKSEVCKAMEKLPVHINPIGGHPMCGKEVGGIQAAEADLFEGAAFALTPLARTSESTRRLAAEVVQEIGANVVWLDAETHDRWVACVSHVPYLLASALVASTPLSAATMVGTGFRSTSRLAMTPTSMMASVLRTNRDFILQGLVEVQKQLDEMRELLENNDDRLVEKLDATAERLKKLLGKG